MARKSEATASGSGAAGQGQTWAVEGPPLPTPPPSVGSGKTGNQTRGMAGYMLI